MPGILKAKMHAARSYTRLSRWRLSVSSRHRCHTLRSAEILSGAEQPSALAMHFMH